MNYRDLKEQANSFPISMQSHMADYNMYCKEGNTEEMSNALSRIKDLVDNTKFAVDKMLEEQMKDESIDQQVKNAYADCWMSDTIAAYKIRNLNFRASEAVDKDDAIALLHSYVQSYNAFDPDLLEYLPDDSMITIAREGSVCLYIKSRALQGSLLAQRMIKKAMDADEFSYDEANEEFRIWWD